MSDTKKKPRPKTKKPYVRKGRKTKLMKMAKRVPKHWMDREDEKEREKNPRKKEFIVAFRKPNGETAYLSLGKKLANIHIRTDMDEVVLFSEKQVKENVAKGFALIFVNANRKKLESLGYQKIEVIPAGKK